MQTDSAYAIGIDIGTTSVKATLLHKWNDSDSRQLCSRSLEHHAYTRGCGVRSGTTAQQDVPSILHAVDEVMALLRAHAPADSFAQASHIGIACQMHGVVMWNKEAASDAMATPASSEATLADSVFSPLVTWEDQRCSGAFLQQLNLHAEPAADPSAPSLSGQRVSNGFGMASLAYLASQPSSSVDAARSSLDPSRYHHAGTIGDLLVFLLTQQRVHAMDHTNAAAWGMYCMQKGKWQTDRIARARIPLSLLPPLVASSAPLGSICPRIAARWGLPVELRIRAAVGDHPASVYATLPLEHQLTVSIGTSSQISRVAQTAAEEAEAVTTPAAPASATAAATPGALQPPSLSAVERRPYTFPFSQRTLLLCASLNGGNVLQTFVEGMERATRELSYDDDDDHPAPSSSHDDEQRKRRMQRMFARLIREAKALHQQQADSPAGAAVSSQPTCDARFFGERSAPDARGSFSHLTFPLLSASQPLGGAAAVFLALCKGVIANLRSLIDSGDGGDDGSAASTHPMLRDLRSVRCVGAAMQRNPLLPMFVSEVFGVPSDRVLVASAESAQGDADAAHGAALLALDWTTTNSRLWERTD